MAERDAQAATDVLGRAGGWAGARDVARHSVLQRPPGSQLSAHSRVLQEARLAARDVRVDALLSSGRFQEGVGEAVGLVEEYPYHGNAHAQLPRALYAPGRGAAALDVYQSLRRGWPPTRSLHHVMLQDRPDQRYLSVAGVVR